MPYIGQELYVPTTSNFVLDQFTATAGQTAFTLSQAPASANAIIVLIGGIHQEPGVGYTVSGTTLTTTAGVPVGVHVFVLHIGFRTATIAPSDGSVGQLAFSAGAPFVRDTARNLAVRTHVTTPLSQLTVTADEVVLKTSGGLPYLASSVNVSPAITASGANGLDTGAEGASTWYYVWVIAKQDGTIAGLLSTSATNPTMPTGYLYKVLVSAVYNSSGSNFVAYRQFGNKVWYEARQLALNNGNSTTEVAVSVSTLIPPIAVEFTIHDNYTITSDVNGHTIFTYTYRFISTLDFFVLSNYQKQNTGSVAGDMGGVQLTMPNVGQQFYYLAPNPTAGTTQQLDVYVQSFKLPIGGE